MNIIAKRFKLIQKYGSGQFGSVCKAQCIKTNKMYAVKLEHLSCEFRILKHESTILHYLNTQKCCNIPYIYYYGNQSPYICMVISFYDYSLKQEKSTMCLNDKIKWWNTAITCIEKIHKSGIVHRDLKPEHFMRSISSGGEWNLIDFGLSTSYLVNGDHIDDTLKNNIIGTPNYASYYVLQGHDVVRRDDFISLFYIFLDILCDNILNIDLYKCIDEEFCEPTCIDFPYNKWLSLQREWSNVYQKLEIDEKIKKLVIYDYLLAITMHCERLGFYDKPNYSNFLINCI